MACPPPRLLALPVWSYLGFDAVGFDAVVFATLWVPRRCTDYAGFSDAVLRDAGAYNLDEVGA